MYIGEKSVTASFNIIKDEVDIRFGSDMLDKNSCTIMMGRNMLGFNDMAITTPTFDTNSEKNGKEAPIWSVPIVVKMSE